MSPNCVIYKYQQGPYIVLAPLNQVLKFILPVNIFFIYNYVFFFTRLKYDSHWTVVLFHKNLNFHFLAVIISFFFNFVFSKTRHKYGTYLTSLYFISQILQTKTFFSISISRVQGGCVRKKNFAECFFSTNTWSDTLIFIGKILIIFWKSRVHNTKAYMSLFND